MRNCTLTGNQLFQDILSYSLPLIGCSESSSDEDISIATGGPQNIHFCPNILLKKKKRLNIHVVFYVVEKYMKKLFGPNKDRMGIDQKAVLLVSKVNESKRHSE